MRSWEDEYGFNLYPKRPVTLVRGQGTRVWDDEGKEYIDCSAGHGVANIGHCNPVIAKALTKQANRLITCSSSFYNNTRASYLKKLVGVTPPGLNRTFLCNSGTESVEAALKFARFSTGRTGLVSAVRGFHGRTMGALSVSFKPEFKKSFEPLIGDTTCVPFNNIEKLSSVVTDKTAAVILEIVQGEGGVRIGDIDYFRQARKLCSDRGALLILDEVQTGFCRTGKFWACEKAQIIPDILCAAKGIAGGIPMGATICSDNIRVPVGKHGSTFGGNPLSCAAAEAALEFMLEEDLAAQAEQKGNYFFTSFPQDIQVIREVRQIGLMIGIELRKRVFPFLDSLLKRGVLAIPAGKNVLRLLPPLVISKEELDLVIDQLIDVLREA